MRKTWTAKDFKLMSAASQLWGLFLIVVMLIAGRPDFALVLFIGFWIGATCASWGAKSREMVMVEGVEKWSEKIDQQEDAFIARQLDAQRRDPNYVSTPADEEMARYLKEHKKQ